MNVCHDHMVRHGVILAATRMVRWNYENEDKKLEVCQLVFVTTCALAFRRCDEGWVERFTTMAGARNSSQPRSRDCPECMGTAIAVDDGVTDCFRCNGSGHLCLICDGPINECDCAWGGSP